MMGLLKDKVALVTGCDRGIGLSICRLFAREGATVYANILNPESERKVKDYCNENTDSVIPVCFDITDQKDTFSCVKRIKREQDGKLDILINNAGIIYDGLIEMIPEKKFTRMLNVNVIGAHIMTQASLKLMKKNPYGGVVVNMASIVGIKGNTGQSAYGASKAAIVGMTKSWSKELAPYKIRVNAVAPGSINTDMFYTFNEDTRKRSIEAAGMKRLGEPEEVANVVLFLACDMSSYITGEIVGVNGGQLL